MGIDPRAVTEWFAGFLDTYGACGRGDRDIAALLPHYGVPLLLTSDEGFVVLDSEDRVAAAMQGQLGGLRAAGYHHTDLVRGEVTVLNATSALYRAGLSRVHADGRELEAVAVTYVLTEGPRGLQISVLAAHSA
jgi:hypothetical protein